MYCLYTRVVSSLDWPNVVLVSAGRTLKWIFALVLMSVYVLKDIRLSYVIWSVAAVFV